jgi:hypothetical protein
MTEIATWCWTPPSGVDRELGSLWWVAGRSCHDPKCGSASGSAGPARTRRRSTQTITSGTVDDASGGNLDAAVGTFNESRPRLFDQVMWVMAPDKLSKLPA